MVAHVENIEAPPLDEGIYGDYDDPDNDIDAAWNAGYEAAKEELEN